MNIIIEGVQEISMSDYVIAITAIVSLILSMISLIKTFRDSKLDENNKIMNIIANNYSYPIIENGKNCEVIIPTDSKCVVHGNIDLFNILNLRNEEITDNYKIEIHFEFKNISKIFPTSVLIDTVTIFYESDSIGNQKILKKALNFKSIDNQYKILYIDGDKNICFKIICLINKEIRDEIIHSLDKDDTIQISFDFSFINIFNVITEGTYDTCLKKIKVKKTNEEEIIGLNNNSYTFKTDIVQYQNKRVYYKKIE